MNISTNKTMSAICWPLIKICQWMGHNTPSTLVKLRYFARFKRFPNLKNPQDLNEKILWLKLYSDTSSWTELADKYRVRNHLEKMGLGNYLVKLYAKWDKAEDIDFDALPNSLIFKANNGDGKGTNLIVQDLRNADKKKLRDIFNNWLNNRNVGLLGAEPQYQKMEPCIIAEELLPIPMGETSLIDYKIWCINGEPQYIRTYCNRSKDGGEAESMTYDTEWNACPKFNKITSHYHAADLLHKPKNLDEMLELARKLSKGFPILRVDLYNIEGKIYFGELTFTSNGGMMNSVTPEFLIKLGEMADLSGIAKVRN